MKDIIIIGAGGVGREVAFIIEEINKQTPTLNILGLTFSNSLYPLTISALLVFPALTTRITPSALADIITPSLIVLTGGVSIIRKS